MLDCSQSQTSQTEFICHSLQKYRRESCIANQNWRFVVGQLGLKLGFDWMNLKNAPPLVTIITTEMALSDCC